MDYRGTMERLLQGGELSALQAEEFLEAAVSGGLEPTQIGAVLVALQAKGATGGEIAAFARVLRAKAVSVAARGEHLVDTCGTGGGTPSFNISTAAAFVASAGGAAVAKHGNRAITSSCGSADVLEACGAVLTGDPEVLAHQLETVGVAFLFAPNHHPALQAVGAVRRSLQVRTVFNQLGPLANPCGVRRQVVGVYDPKLAEPMAEALAVLGAERALVVHSRDGMDEVSPCAPTDGYLVESGEVAPWSFDPAEVGALVPPVAVLPGESPQENAAILREALGDPASPRSLAVLPCAAAALFASGIAESMEEGLARAREAISTGSAAAKFGAWLEVTRLA